jgi:pyruvate dehydrogenase (quinone)
MRLKGRRDEMGENVSQFILRRLHEEWDVGRIYGYPGDGINGLLGAFHEHGDKIEFIQTRHEELAAFMACGHAKMTGEVGVCMATSGPGAIHLLNGLYDAKLDHQPVVAIIGQQKTMSIGANYQQEIDLQVLFKDVASEFCAQVSSAPAARHIVDRAFRVAQASRSVACVIVPADIQEDAYSDPPRMHGAVFSGGTITRPHVVPRDVDLQRAADVLNGGQRVAMLIGQGAKEAADEVAQVADVLGCGVARALNGRDALPDDLPWLTGSIGLLGTKPSEQMMAGCDTLFMVGTSFPYSEWLPKPGQARGVQIDLDARMLGVRYPMEVALCGDSRDTLQALLPLLERKQERSWREEIEGNVARWWEILEDRSMQAADPVNPQRVFWELNDFLPDRAIVTADSGSGTNWWARELRLRKGMKAALSGTLATMCPAMPYALAAKFAYPDRPVIAVEGDGSMQMNGINSLIDAAHYYERWSDPRLIVLVVHNNDLNQVTWEQRVLAGDAKLEASQVLPDFPFAEYARMLGLDGVRVEHPDQIRPAWEQAVQADRPFVFEAITDPNVPPLPPHIRMEQAKKMGMALIGGEEDEGPGIMKQAIKGKWQELVNR